MHDPVLERKLVGLLGLGVRARNVVIGVERVRDAARRGRLKVAFVAPDASANSRDKVLPLLEAKRVQVYEGLSAMVLGEVVGKESTAAIGVIDAALASGLRRLIDPARDGGRDPGPERTR